MNYYIADLHYNHENVIRYDNRPFQDVCSMNDTLIRNWNGKVNGSDTVYILGDFIWGNEDLWLETVPKFNGNKILILGNHDPKQFSTKLRNMFSDIKNLLEIKDIGKHIVMCHYPIPFFRGSCSDTSYMFYGHVHITEEYNYMKELRRNVLKGSENGSKGHFINVGCMMPYMNYTPMSAEEIIHGDNEYIKTLT